MDGVIDVSEEDLVEIYELAVKHAQNRDGKLTSWFFGDEGCDKFSEVSGAGNNADPGKKYRINDLKLDASWVCQNELSQH